MDITKILKEAGVKSPAERRRDPLWKGPKVDGITQSLLGRFLVCRERFRILVIEGLKSDEGWNHRLGYGEMWHVCEEALARGTGTHWQDALKLHCQSLCAAHRTQQAEINKWYNVCKVQFPIYVQYWDKHADVVEREPLLQEQVFNVPYELPSGDVVRLRGKWDSVDLIGTKKPAIYLQENKTKGDIKEGQLKRQLTFDLQTMLYLVALQKYDWSGDTFSTTVAKKPFPVAGIRYNVIRRPLSGGKGSIIQKKPTKTNPAGETTAQYYARLQKYIIEEPQTYFMRWKVEVPQDDIERFQREFLNPVLQQLVDWYAWVTTGDPFRAQTQIDGEGYPDGLIYHHWRHPFGVYNIMDEGGATDLDEYIATGSEVGLQRVDRLFHELDVPQGK